MHNKLPDAIFKYFSQLFSRQLSTPSPATEHNAQWNCFVLRQGDDDAGTPDLGAALRISGVPL
jgi:hypothetical protein